MRTENSIALLQSNWSRRCRRNSKQCKPWTDCSWELSDLIQTCQSKNYRSLPNFSLNFVIALIFVAMEAVKVLKILQSSKAPLVKKRQAMRNTFGDYRAKMRKEQAKSAASKFIYPRHLKKISFVVSDFWAFICEQFVLNCVIEPSPFPNIIKAGLFLPGPFSFHFMFSFFSVRPALAWHILDPPYSLCHIF